MTFADVKIAIKYTGTAKGGGGTSGGHAPLPRWSEGKKEREKEKGGRLV